MVILFSGNFGYLCLAMRKKFGDWLLDIAKYMATAILLTSIFSDMQNIWTYVIVAISQEIKQVRNEYNNRLRFYPAHCHSRLNLFCSAGQEREKSTQYALIHCVTSIGFIACPFLFTVSFSSLCLSVSSRNCRDKSV